MAKNLTLHYKLLLKYHGMFLCRNVETNSVPTAASTLSASAQPFVSQVVIKQEPPDKTTSRLPPVQANEGPPVPEV